MRPHKEVCVRCCTREALYPTQFERAKPKYFSPRKDYYFSVRYDERAIMCAACVVEASAPPFQVLALVMLRLNIREACRAMRAAREWAAVVRTGDCFTTISVSPDLWRFHQGASRVTSHVLAHILSLAPRCRSLLLEGLPQLTTLTGLSSCTILESLVITDCAKLDLGLALVACLPPSLRCLRLAGESLPSTQQLALLKALPCTVALDTCERCDGVCIPDEALVCDRCGRDGFCSRGSACLATTPAPGTHAYDRINGGVSICSVCATCACRACDRSWLETCFTQCNSCEELFCPGCQVDECGRQCDYCNEHVCEDCQAGQAWHWCCEQCDRACCENCREHIFMFNCERCSTTRCDECATVSECARCHNEFCSGCARVEHEITCSECGELSAEVQVCPDCPSPHTTGCRECETSFCLECLDEDVLAARKRLGLPVPMWCGGCGNMYCGDCHAGRVQQCDGCEAVFACDTPACQEANRARVCEVCQKQYCAHCLCACEDFALSGEHVGEAL